MSVIVRRNNQIILYCKGADNVIYDRLSSDQSELKSRTQEHLNVISPYSAIDFLPLFFGLEETTENLNHFC